MLILVSRSLQYINEMIHCFGSVPVPENYGRGNTEGEVRHRRFLVQHDFSRLTGLLVFSEPSPTTLTLVPVARLSPVRKGNGETTQTTKEMKKMKM